MQDTQEQSNTATRSALPALGPEHADQWPVFAAEEQAAVAAVLASGKVNYLAGNQGRQFEQAFAERMGCRFGVAVTNGTVALELALRAAGVGPGDEVVVPCRSFIATASVVVQVGAVPVFADVDRNSQVLTPATVAAVLGPRTRAVIPVHLAGWPCDVPALRKLCGPSVVLIEDCAQAHGARLAGQPVGSFGDMAAWSFCQDKIISTGGEGGMVTTSNSRFHQRLWSLKDHGKQLADQGVGDSSGQFRWLHQGFGSNARMTEMQAAIGRVQLRRLDGWLDRRRSIAAALADACRDAGVFRVPRVPHAVDHAWYRFDTFVEPAALADGWDRDRLLAALRAEGINCGTGACPEIYREAAFVGHPSVPPEPLPVARELGATSIMLPVYPTLCEATLGRICATIRTLGQRARNADSQLGQSSG